MLLKQQYFEFDNADIMLMVSKMFRKNLSVKVTMVLISEIDINYQTVSALIIMLYFKHAIL